MSPPAQPPFYFHLADVTVQVSSNLPLTEHTFAEKLSPFRTDTPTVDLITIHHHFSLPADSPTPTGATLIYSSGENSLAVYQRGKSWIYDMFLGLQSGPFHYYRAICNADHTRADIYHHDADIWSLGEFETLTLLTTDQILFGRVFADRQGCIIHAAGMELWGKGFLFVGHSEAGKSTTVTMLRKHGTILCDDRIVARRSPAGFRIHGTWSHGTVPDISPASAPLRAICFLEQSDENQATLLTDRRDILQRLLPCLVQPLVTPDWWEKTLATVEHLVDSVPAYRLRCDLSGRISDVVRQL